MAILPINGFQKIQSAGLKVGNITSLQYGSQPTVEITGTPPNQLLNVGIPAGKPGDNGSSPLLTIGKVTTLSAGSQATASISGTAPAFTLDIGIPAGQPASSPIPLTPSAPAALSVSMDTAYQLNASKPASLSVMIEAVYVVTVATAMSDVVELWIGPDNTVATATAASPGTSKKLASFSAGLTGISVSVGMSTTHRNQLFGILPSGYYFAVRRVSGTRAIIKEAYSQTLF